MVEMICAHQKVTKAEARNMAEEALKRVGIPDARRRMEAYPYELSGRYVPEGYHSHVRVQQTADDHCG